MGEFKKRLISIIGCVIFTLGLLTWNSYTASIYYTILTVLSLFEYHSAKNTTKRIITIILSLKIYLILVFVTLDVIPINYIIFILPLLFSFFIIELFFGNIVNIGADLIGVIWISLPFSLCLSISNLNYYYDYTPVIGIMLLVFFNDAGSYCVGKLCGKTKLYPKISPNKTWEGSIGGAVVSFLVYFPVKHYLICFTHTQWTIILILSVICGSVGDLIESMFKRNLNIKDSGKVLPGHGGILDRCDGLLFSIPFIYTYIIITL